MAKTTGSSTPTAAVEAGAATINDGQGTPLPLPELQPEETAGHKETSPTPATRQWPVPVIPKIPGQGSHSEVQPSTGGEVSPASMDKSEIIEPVLCEPEPQDDTIEEIDESALIITHEPSEILATSKEAWLDAEEIQQGEAEAEEEQDGIDLSDIIVMESAEPFVVSEEFMMPPTAEISFEVAPIDIETAVAADEETLQEMLSEALQPLEPGQAEAAAELIEEIQELAIAVHETDEEESPAKEKLKKKLAQLFEAINKDYDEETIEKFINSILLENLALPKDVKDDLNLDPGTREKKITSYLIVRNLSFLINKIPSLFKLGKFALNYTRQISL